MSKPEPGGRVRPGQAPHRLDKVFVGDGTSAQLLKFGNIYTRDAVASDDLNQLKTRLAEFGNITVIAYRSNTARRKSKKPWSVEKSVINEIIPETVLKGRSVSSGVSFWEAVELKRPLKGVRDVVEAEQPGIVAFHLRYRTKEDLQIIDVIPRSPSPDQLDDEEIDNLDAEALRAVLRKHKAKQALANRIKQEKPDPVSSQGLTEPSDSQPKRGVKRSRAPTIDEEDHVTVDEERTARGRSRPPPAAEVIEISD